MENEAFILVNETVLEEESHLSWTDYVYAWTELIHLLTSLVALSVLIFLVFTIFRFKRLKTKTNMLLLNLFIVEIAYYPMVVLVFVVEQFGSYKTSMITFQIQNSLVLLVIIFSLLLAFDWFITCYKPNWVSVYRKFEKYIYGLIYVIALLELIVAAVIIIGEYHHFVVYAIRVFVANIIYTIALIAMIVMNVLKRKLVVVNESASKTAYSFTVACIIIFTMLPSFIWNLMYIVLGFAFDAMSFFLFSFIPSIFWAMHPIWITFKLGAMNKNFSMAYAKSCRKRLVRDYDDDGLDEDPEDDENNFVRNNGVHSETVI